MSEYTPKSMRDGFWAVPMGVDSGRSPDLLGRDILAFAVNCTFRGGFVDQRPGLNSVALTFGAGIQAAVEDGNMQCAYAFDAWGGDPRIIATISGRVFSFDIVNESVSELTVDQGANPAACAINWMQQAEGTLIIQDGLSLPILFDGANARRSNLADMEVPVGKQMAYGMGRLWVALANGRDFVGSDIVGGPTGVLKFTENDYLNEGGAFGIPANAGQISGMIFLSNLDTSLGQGPMLVSTPDSMFTVQAPADRSTWKNLTYPIQTVSLLEAGAKSHQSMVSANGDVFFRSKDGVRSFLVARREFGEWGNTPVSKEITRVLGKDTPALLDYSQAVVFNNRLLMTCSPAPYTTTGGNFGVGHQGLVVLDFDLLGSMSRKEPPAWDGLWVFPGLKIVKIVKGLFGGEERCFLFCRNASNKLGLYELSKADAFDTNETRIKSSIETPAFHCDAPHELKRLDSGDISTDRVMGTVDWALDYRTDQNPCWTDWVNWQTCATRKDCDTEAGSCKTVTSYREGFSPKLRFPSPPDTCDSGVSRLNRVGFLHQLRLEWTGRARIKMIRILAGRVQEHVNGDCLPASATCQEITCCDPDPFS